MSNDMKKPLSFLSSAALAVVLTVPVVAGTPEPMARKVTRGLDAFEQKAKFDPDRSTRGLNMPQVRKGVYRGSNSTISRSVPAVGLSLKGRLRAAADVSLPELYGSVVYNHSFTSSNQPYGLYKIDRTTTTMVYEGINANYGGVAVDGVYYVTDYFDFMGTPIIQVNGYDLGTGEEVSSATGSFENVAIGGLALDPTSGKCYGITLDAEGQSMQLTEIDYSPSGVTTTTVAPMAGSWISMACDAQGQLYGISYQVSGTGQNATTTSSTLYKIDKHTGATTRVGTTGQLPQYLSGAAIDPVSGRMFWCVSPADDSGLLCEVNLSTGVATVIGQFENGDEVCGLFVDAPAAPADAPAAVTGLTASFPKGTLSGTVDFTAPSTLFDGTAASGSLDYKVMANGTAVAQGKTSFGAKVSASVTLSQPGDYKFSVTVSNDAGTSPRADVSAYVGNGVPVAPVPALAYADGKMQVSWSAVTMSADGGYVDPDAVRYTVTRYPDGKVVADKIAATSFAEPMAEPEAFTVYSYGVKAHFAELTSAEGRTAPVGIGSVRPPYTNSFDDASSIDGYTVLDSNSDKVKWEYADGAVAISYNTMAAMDDWFITPPLKLEGGKVYTVSLRAAAMDPGYNERIEICWGAAPVADAMTGTIVGPTVLVSNEYRTLTGVMAPSADGLYYVGIHGISDADMYMLYVDDLSVSAGVVSDAPGMVTDINVVSDSHGAYKTTVSFKAPTLTAAGAALTSLTKIELSRDGKLIHTFDKPAPGAALSCEDNVGAEGSVNYTIVAYNAAGAGAEAAYQALVGIGQPAAPANVKAVEDLANPGMVTVTWDPVTADANGNPVDASLITYIVAQYSSSAGQYVPVSNELNTTSYTFRAVNEGSQSFVQLAVFAFTANGQNAAAADMLACGTPYEGMHETFAGGSLQYNWSIDFVQGSAAWDIYTGSQLGIPAQDGDDGLTAMQASAPQESAALISGKISLAGMTDPGVTFYVYNISSTCLNTVRIYAKEAGTAEWVPVTDAIATNSLNGGAAGWAKVSASLAAYAGKSVQLRIQGTCVSHAYLIIDNITVGNLAQNDLKAEGITAPSSARSGEAYKVAVTVFNEGKKDAAGFAVALYTDGAVTATKDVASLKAGASTVVEFETAMSMVASNPVAHYAVVDFASDENLSNNTTATVEVRPILSKLPAPSGLAGEFAGNDVKLTWSAPSYAGTSLTYVEDFESGVPFGKEFDGWTFIDRDGADVGGFQGLDLPGISGKISFFVFDGSDFSATFGANSGSKFLAALYRQDMGTTDDWAISPELSGDAQTITFFARSYDAQYPEKIEMLYSTGSLNPDDFILVKTVAKVPGDYTEDGSAVKFTEMSFDVPAGAKYFAIRSCATDSFMLELDDFSYVPAGASELTLTGYEVYRDGQLITPQPVTACEFVDAGAADAVHTYAVVAVYESGRSAASNAVTLDKSGIDAVGAGMTIGAADGAIVIKGAEDTLVTVADVAGKVIYRGEAEGETRISVAAGVYVVQAGRTTAKLIVR